MQADEQASRADTTATVQVDQMAPLLQLSDTQRDQVMSALYQVQVAAPDPTSLMTNPNAASIIANQAQATQEALAKVLTPAQMALYQQQAQAMPTYGGMGRRGFGEGGNGGGTANPNPAGGTGAAAGTTGYTQPAGTTAPVPTTVVAPQVVNPPAGQANVSGSVSTNASAAATNAAPAQ